MVLIMDMSSGHREDEFARAYGDEVLHANWTPVPRLEPRLELVASSRNEPSAGEAEAFLARLYALQE